MSDEPKPLKLISEKTMQRIREGDPVFNHVHRALVATIDHDRKSAKEVIDLLMARIAVQKNRADHWEGLANMALPESVAMHQRVIAAWSAPIFTESTPDTTVAHLVEEAHELKESHDPEEAADVYIMLIQFCNKAGIDLMREYEKKMQINMRRTWNPPDKDGIVRHVKGESQ